MAVISILISLILILLSSVSFIPQFQRILSRGNGSGLSLNYLLFNLITATEQLTIALHFFIDNVEVLDGIVKTPPTIKNWLNLIQFAVFWVSHSVILLLYFYFPPERRAAKLTAMTIYFAFLLISLFPVIFEAFLPKPGSASPEHDDRWFMAILGGVHTMFINPVVTMIAVAAFVAQARELLSRSSIGALSVIGLAAQTLVFTIVAASWLFRMKMPRGYWRRVTLGRIISWYQLMGWAAVDTAIFAVGQGILLMIAMRRRGEEAVTGETNPLLNDD